jgi:hypothetical protein
MIAASSDAGATMLELLIGLGLFAGLLVVTVSVIGPTAPLKNESHAVASFISAARSDAILSGEAGALTVGPEGLAFGRKTLALAAPPVGTEAARLVLYPDGTLAGDAASFARAVGLAQIAGTFRGTGDE